LEGTRLLLGGALRVQWWGWRITVTTRGFAGQGREHSVGDTESAANQECVRRTVEPDLCQWPKQAPQLLEVVLHNSIVLCLGNVQLAWARGLWAPATHIAHLIGHSACSTHAHTRRCFEERGLHTHEGKEGVGGLVLG
jgi:hypothetical protein